MDILGQRDVGPVLAVAAMFRGEVDDEELFVRVEELGGSMAIAQLFQPVPDFAGHRVGLHKRGRRDLSDAALTWGRRLQDLIEAWRIFSADRELDFRREVFRRFCIFRGGLVRRGWFVLSGILGSFQKGFIGR